MSEPVLLYSPDAAGSAIEFDAILTESHRREAEATRHPVESRADVSDHIIRGPRTLEIVGVVSNYPIIPAGELAKDWLAEEEKRLKRHERVRRAAGLAGPLILLTDQYEPGTPPALEPFDRARLAWNRLEELWRNSTLVRIVTRLSDYPRMAIVGLDVPRDARTASELRVTISLEEIHTVDAQVAEVPAELLRPARVGPQTTRPATPAQAREATDARDRSLLHRLIF